MGMKYQKKVKEWHHEDILALTQDLKWESTFSKNNMHQDMQTTCRYEKWQLIEPKFKIN